MTTQKDETPQHEINHDYLFNVYFQPGSQYTAQKAEIEKLEKIVKEMKEALVKEAAKDAQSRVPEIAQAVQTANLQQNYAGIVNSLGEADKPHVSISCTREVVNVLNALECVDRIEPANRSYKV